MNSNNQFDRIHGGVFLDNRYDLRSVKLCSMEGICGLFNDAVGTTGCIASNGRMTSMGTEVSVI